MIDKYYSRSLPDFRYELSSRGNRYDAWSGDTSKKKIAPLRRFCTYSPTEYTYRIFPGK
jgi:hypothetical protein